MRSTHLSTVLAVVALALGAIVVRTDAQAALAPSGTLRGAFIAGNPAMAGKKDPATGEPMGPAIDILRELARQSGTGVQLLGVATPQAVIDAVRTGQADIGLVAYNPEREGAVAFSQPFMLVQQSFLVKQDSPIKSVADIDRAGNRIGARRADSIALYLDRNLKQARLVEIVETTGREGAEAVLAGEMEAFGSNRQRLSDALRTTTGLRLLPDDLYGVEQTIIIPPGHSENLSVVNTFIDRVRANGFLQASFTRSGAVGIAVAPAK